MLLFLFLMYKQRIRKTAAFIKAQLLYLLKKYFLFVVKSIHLNAKAIVKGHGGEGLNAQDMN